MDNDFDKILNDFEEALLALEESEEDIQKRIKVYTIIHEELRHYLDVVNHRSCPNMFAIYHDFLNTDRGRLAIYKDYLFFSKVKFSKLLSSFSKMMKVKKGSPKYNSLKMLSPDRLAVVMAIKKQSDFFYADNLNKMA